MNKILTAASLALALTGMAHAQSLPVPPTNAYSPAAASACQSQTLQIYFGEGSAVISPASRTVLTMTKETLRGCVIGPVSMEAHAADIAAPDLARTLARARLATVVEALDQHQLSGTHVATDVAPATPVAFSTPKHRTVEIQLSAWTPEIS